jgi:pSer/pThr/pTyr-binding forkhead associated (FHA) protein
VKPQAPVKPAGPAQAAVQAAEAPIKPASPVPVKPEPASAVAPPPVAPKPVVPPKVDVAPKPPQTAKADQPAQTLAADPRVEDVEGTLTVGVVRAPRIRGVRLVGAGIPISLGLGTFIVGRAVGSDVRLDDRQVSRSHARITVDETSAMLEDLQTVNGTLLNGKEVKARQPLHGGDTIQFGASQFKVELTTG